MHIWLGYDEPGGGDGLDGGRENIAFTNRNNHYIFMFLIE